MNVLEIYLKISGPLDAAAAQVARALGVKFEKRHGQNRGGYYFQGSDSGFLFELLQNAGEVRIPERESWPFYVLISADPAQRSNGLSEHEYAERLLGRLRENEIDAEVDSLS